MDDWVYWLGAAGVFVIVEIFTGTFYLLMVAVGLVAGAAAAWGDLNRTLQFVAAALVGMAATFALHRSRLGSAEKIDSASNANINIDIGQNVTVGEWRIEPGNRPAARVMYRGAMWDVELSAGESAHSGVFTICALRGSRLIVTGAPK